MELENENTSKLERSGKGCVGTPVAVQCGQTSQEHSGRHSCVVDILTDAPQRRGYGPCGPQIYKDKGPNQTKQKTDNKAHRPHGEPSSGF